MGPRMSSGILVVLGLSLAGRIQARPVSSCNALLCASLDDLRGARCWHEVRAATLHSVDQILIHNHDAAMRIGQRSSSVVAPI